VRFRSPECVPLTCYFVGESDVLRRDRGILGGIHMWERVVARATRAGCALVAATAITGGMISMPTGRYQGAVIPVQTHFVQLQAVGSSIALGTTSSEGTHTGSSDPGPAAAVAETAIGSRLETFLVGAQLVLTGIVLTPFWFLATPITLPLAYISGSFSAMYGNDQMEMTLKFYALPLQLIFVGISVMFDPPTPSAAAAGRPASSEPLSHDGQESPAGSSGSPTAIITPAAERSLRAFGDRSRSEPASGHRVATVPLRRAASSVPASESISPNSPTGSDEAGAPAQNGGPEQLAGSAATEQAATSDMSRKATASRSKSVRSR